MGSSQYKQLNINNKQSEIQLVRFSLLDLVCQLVRVNYIWLVSQSQLYSYILVSLLEQSQFKQSQLYSYRVSQLEKSQLYRVRVE